MKWLHMESEIGLFFLSLPIISLILHTHVHLRFFPLNQKTGLIKGEMLYKLIDSPNWEQPLADHLLNPTSDQSCCSALADQAHSIKYPDSSLTPSPPASAGLSDCLRWKGERTGEASVGETDGGMKGEQKRGKINCGFSWEHNLGKCMQPTADNMIISKEKKNKTEQKPTSLHYAEEDVKRSLVLRAGLDSTIFTGCHAHCFISATSLRNNNNK